MPVLLNLACSVLDSSLSEDEELDKAGATFIGGIKFNSRVFKYIKARPLKELGRRGGGRKEKENFSGAIYWATYRGTGWPTTGRPMDNL